MLKYSTAKNTLSYSHPMFQDSESIQSEFFKFHNSIIIIFSDHHGLIPNKLSNFICYKIVIYIIL